jgi:hypothetical protein
MEMFTLEERSQEKKDKWYVHLGMDPNWIPGRIVTYKPVGRRDVGRPRRRWEDCLSRKRPEK